MRESHCSLRDLFEVSCRELDTWWKLRSRSKVIAAGGMTGGGFGGCTVNLVKSGGAATFAAQISERYRASTGIKPDIYICSAADGAGGSSKRSARRTYCALPEPSSNEAGLENYSFCCRKSRRRQSFRSANSTCGTNPESRLSARRFTS